MAFLISAYTTFFPVLPFFSSLHLYKLNGTNDRIDFVYLIDQIRSFCVSDPLNCRCKASFKLLSLVLYSFFG